MNCQDATDLVERHLQSYQDINSNLPEEKIVDTKEIPYGWYFKIGLKYPSCSRLYYNSYTDYIIDREYGFVHIVDNLRPEEEVASYGEKRKSWRYRMWWRFTSLLKSLMIKGQLYAKSLKKAAS